VHNIILIDGLFYVLGAFALRKKPMYRHVKKYYKSLGQYWRERKRRKLVLKLHEEGLSQKQIAERLGASVRTVKRDFAKVKPYYVLKVQY
jgi:DNA invertase Pin-like site-specific DNA recombinase